MSLNSIGSRPVSPISSDLRAFCKLSENVLPKAIASPTDFIDVLSKGFASGNFSNANLGILVTM